MKRAYRFALVNLIGLVGAVGSMVSVWSMYFTGNKDFLVPFVIFGLITWFYIEVVVPKRPKVVGNKTITEDDYTSIFNKEK